MTGEVTTMHISPESHTPRRPGLPALLAVLALLGAGAALAQSTIDPTSFTTKSGTLWRFIHDHSSRLPSATCFGGSHDPSTSFTCLEQVLTTAGLDGTLRGAGPVTLFAPTDAGFETLQHLMGNALFNRLMHDPKRLASLLKGLMVTGSYTSADLKARAVPATGRLTLPTLAGNELQLTFDRFPTSTQRVKVAVGKETFQPAWTPYLSGHTTLLSNGAIIPMDMVYLPPSMR